MKSRRVALSALSIAAALAPSACGTSTSSSNAGSSTIAPAVTAPKNGVCGLLTSTELTAALGAPIDKVRPIGGSGWILVQCNWTAGTTSASLAIGSIDSLAKSGVRTTLSQWVSERRQAEAKQFPITDLVGVGDGGYLRQGNAPIAIAYRGSLVMEVIVSSPESRVDPGVARALIGAAIAKLPAS